MRRQPSEQRPGPSAITPDQLATVESRLAADQYARILILEEQTHQLSLFLNVVDHLLNHEPHRRLLLLGAASAQAALLQGWKHRFSSIDHQTFEEQYGPLVSSEQWHASEGRRVCFATLREIQLLLRQGIHYGKHFDVALLYSLPVRPSPLWHTVVEALTLPLIGFASQSLSWFSHLYTVKARTERCPSPKE